MFVTKILYRRLRFDKRTIRAGRNALNCMIADSFPKQMLGLMYRKSLRKSEGMLFIFRREGIYPIWMMNMNFPIDIIWISKRGKVVDVEENAVPCRGFFGCKSYYPRKKSQYVLEMCSGEAGRRGIKIGSKIRL